MKNLLLALPIICIVVLSGCSMFEEDEESEYGKLFFSAQYLYRPDYLVDELSLVFQTEKTYNPSGYAIEMEQKLEGKTLDMRVVKLQEPRGGRPVPYPATWSVDLDPLRGGTYTLIIRDDHFKDSYILTITDTITYIVGPGTKYTEPTERYIKREAI